VGTPVQPGTLDEIPVAVIGETGDAEVPVPGADDVSLPPRGALGMEKGGEVPLGEVVLDTVTIVVCEFVNVVVRVSGTVMVVALVVVGAVGAVLGGAVSLHGVGKTGDDEPDPVAGLPSVEESTPDGTGNHP
jgi:hypothetical protein